jgi:tripartite-type tricarboxylate transporter receptor subunit TctC
VVENRAGASGNIAADTVAKAAPDGYTLLMGTIAPLAINPSLYATLPFDPVRDFAPISRVADSTNILVVHPALPVRSVKDLVAIAKARPGQLLFGSAQTGSAGHLAGELLNSTVRITTVHVPYKGGAPAMTALLSGEVQLIFASPPTAQVQVKAGKVRPLAVTTAKRSLVLPELPTLAESGLPGYETDNWYGVVVPAKTPRAVVERLNKELVHALNVPEVKDALLRNGLESAPGTPEAFGAYIKSEYRKWGKLIAEAGIAPN